MVTLHPAASGAIVAAGDARALARESKLMAKRADLRSNLNQAKCLYTETWVFREANAPLWWVIQEMGSAQENQLCSSKAR